MVNELSIQLRSLPAREVYHDVALTRIYITVAWLLIRHYSNPHQPVPGWTGINQHSIKDTKDTTMGYLPILNAPAHERDTLWIVIGRCLRITHELNAGQSTVLMLASNCMQKLRNYSGRIVYMIKHRCILFSSRIILFREYPG